MSKPAIFAHRGASGQFPENTMLAFEEALRSGVDGIELDVQLTKDGEVVIIHDEKVDRTTNGQGFVKDFTLAELEELDAGSWFSSKFAGQRLMTLDTVLAWMQEEGNHLRLNIELKNDQIQYVGLEEKVLSLIEDYDLQERIIISSFNPFSLQRVRMQNAEIEMGYLVLGTPENALWIAKEIGANAIHCEAPYALSAYGEAAKRAGYPLRIYTVNAEDEYKQLVEAGVEVIMTDFPERFK
ncbi:glycerophosphodiester phosphodiesterase [Metasolibacillus sp.]|uniref:glycerophosphodiester phosphodiesterase n=1 Tax=Metasolibacillus sp. TaxID=2703680 RepID=UPI0025F65086|nr:glycerophosphodiester phosphodiesterase [Metasolibacillus sp.]MCT6924199.1 glycerophosphodiester phosphodiesterase [Metasolibacillus sp.]MCT6940399.1 glycerophosphodiester phosphodiesterase [Metasolibacillus sp.]